MNKQHDASCAINAIVASGNSLGCTCAAQLGHDQLCLIRVGGNCSCGQFNYVSNPVPVRSAQGKGPIPSYMKGIDDDNEFWDELIKGIDLFDPRRQDHTCEESIDPLWREGAHWTYCIRCGDWMREWDPNMKRLKR